MSKSKLHELLAVEGDLEGTAKKIVEETAHTFKEKASHFMGSHKLYKPIDDKDPGVPDEHLEMVTTVHDKLDYMNDHLIRYADALLQKEATKQQACATLEVDG